MAGSKVKLLAFDDNFVDREIVKLACGILDVSCDTTSCIDDFMDRYKNYDGVVLGNPAIDKSCIDTAIKIKQEDPDFPIVFRTSYTEGNERIKLLSRYGKVIRKDISEHIVEKLRDFVDEVKKRSARFNIFSSKY